MCGVKFIQFYLVKFKNTFRPNTFVFFSENKEKIHICQRLQISKAVYKDSRLKKFCYVGFTACTKFTDVKM